MKAIDLIIFDMDGTIFDTERLGIQKWMQAFKEMGIVVPEQVLYSKIGLGSKDSKEFMQKESGVSFDYDAVKRLKKELTLSHIKEYGTPVKEGFAELSEYIKSNNISIALATSRSRANTEIYLRHAGQGFRNNFNLIITGDMVERGKPNPDIFLLAAKKLNVQAQATIVIEDSINGIKAAVAAQMRAIMIPDLVEPSIEIENAVFAIKRSLREVISLIDSLITG